MTKQCLTRRHENFNTGLKIDMYRHLERCFPFSLPPKCRSNRDAPVGMLVDRNGGRRKISLEKVVDCRVFQRRSSSMRLRDDCNATGV